MIRLDSILIPRNALAYHNILLHAFCRLHGQTQLHALERKFHEGEETIPTSAYLQQLGSTELHQKELKVKSFKAYEFLRAEDSLFRVFLSVAIIRPFERLMYLFMSWQRDDTFLTQRPPLVEMSKIKDSPQMLAVRNYI